LGDVYKIQTTDWDCADLGFAEQIQATLTLEERLHSMNNIAASGDEHDKAVALGDRDTELVLPRIHIWRWQLSLIYI
ncbi:hypothetical protein Q2370_27205, partial [Escherichia coli]|nr:hypothetical protein [Escherichia coli]